MDLSKICPWSKLDLDLTPLYIWIRFKTTGLENLEVLQRVGH